MDIIIMIFATCTLCCKVPRWSCFSPTLTIVSAYPGYDDDDDDAGDDDDDYDDHDGADDDNELVGYDDCFSPTLTIVGDYPDHDDDDDYDDGEDYDDKYYEYEYDEH